MRIPNYKETTLVKTLYGGTFHSTNMSVAMGGLQKWESIVGLCRNQNEGNTATCFNLNFWLEQNVTTNDAIRDSPDSKMQNAKLRLTTHMHRKHRLQSPPQPSTPPSQ
jgi:hypothetical protein